MKSFLALIAWCALILLGHITPVSSQYYDATDNARHTGIVARQREADLSDAGGLIPMVLGSALNKVVQQVFIRQRLRYNGKDAQILVRTLMPTAALLDLQISGLQNCGAVLRCRSSVISVHFISVIGLPYLENTPAALGGISCAIRSGAENAYFTGSLWL